MGKGYPPHFFTLAQGETATFVLTYGSGRPTSLERRDTSGKLAQTTRYWKGLVERMNYEGLWRDQVVRSFLVLHLMMYPKTGAIVAAPTTSLPETLGGSRNWDYRYSWLRDAAFTVDILYRLGDVYGADRYIHWLLEQCQLHRRDTRIVYGISPDSSLREYTLDHLGGYENSRPVRIGNAAAGHIQLDVFGEVIISIHSLLLLHGKIPDEAWELVERLAETVMRSWRLKDRGVWEVRGEQQHFVYSKVMCWAALDYAAYIAAATGHRNLYRRWSLAADTIKTEILDEGWSSAKRAFRQRYGSEALDASNLAIPFMGIVPRDHPRLRQNVDAIERELADGPLVWRYLPDETDDGLGGQPEGRLHPPQLLAHRQPDIHRPARPRLRLLPRGHHHPGQPPRPLRRDVRQVPRTPTRQLPPGLLPHRPHPQRPQPLWLHRRHPHPPLPRQRGLGKPRLEWTRLCRCSRQ